MNYLVRIIVVVILLITGEEDIISAQNPITGIVLDGQKPVAYSTVMVCSDTTSTASIKDYSTTDNAGRFTLNGNYDIRDWLIIRCIGYKKLKKQLGHIRQNLVLQLEEDSHSLENVTIKGHYTGLRFSNDTIKFDTKYYANGTEDNIGDVLGKLPGMEVSKTGKISYAGKEINKVLIDGKDILSSNKNLAISNLPADIMQSAELLTNYKGNSITSPFQKDVTTALNLKTSGKKKFNGSIQVTGGFINKYLTKSNLLYMGDKSSFSAILSANNRGESVFSIEDYINSMIGVENLLSQKKNKYKLSSDEARMLLPPDNVFKQTTGAVALNHMYTPSDKFNIRGNLLYNGSLLNAYSHNEDIYFSGTTINLKDETNKDKNHYLATNWQEKWTLGNGLEINASTHYNLGIYKTMQFLEDRINQNNLASDNSQSLPTYQLIQDVNINQIVGKGIVYSYIHFEMAHSKSNFDVFTDTLLLPVLYHKSSVYNERPYLFSTHTINMNINLSPEVGYIIPLFKNVQLNTSISWHYSKESQKYTEENTNTDIAKFYKSQAGIRLEKNKGFLRFGIGSVFSINYYKGNIFDNNKKTYNFISPEITLQLLFNPRHKINVSASYDRQPTEISYLSRHQKVTGYNAIQKGSNIENPFNRETNISINYSLFDLYTNTTLFLIANYVNKRNLPKTQLNQEGIISMLTYKENGWQNNYFVKGYMNKGLSFVPINLKIACNYSSIEYGILLKNLESNVESQDISTEISLLSRFKSAFNVELAGSYLYKKMSSASAYNHVEEWSSTTKLYYVRGKVAAYLYHTFSHIINAAYRQNNFDIGFSFEYKIKRFSFKLQGKDILHLKNLHWIGLYNTPYYTSSSFYQKLPGYLQASLSYRF